MSELEKTDDVKVLDTISVDSLSLIKISQLPIIEEQLDQLMEAITELTSDIEAMECTEENKQLVKKRRSSLNKLSKDLTKRYKNVLDEVIAPIKKVQDKFANCISLLKKASEHLTGKINVIEDSQKKDKYLVVKAYFEEYAQSKGIDFIDFKDLDIKINLSTTETALKKQIATFLERVATDLKMISTQEDEEEILVEYKKTLNASDAITTVKERKKRIQAEKERKAKEAEERERAAKAEAVVINAAKEQEEQEQAENQPSSDVSFPEAEPGYIPPQETAQPLSAPVAETPKKKYTVKFAVSMFASSPEEAKEQFGKFKPELMSLIERSGLTYER